MDDLDARIPLQSVAPNPMASLASMLDVSAKSLSLQKIRQTFDADVAKSKAESSTAQSGATVNAANVNPLIQQQAAQTSTAQTGAESAKFGLHKNYMDTALQTASGLMNDPRIANSDPAIYNPEHATQAIIEAEKQMVSKGVPETQARMATAPYFNAVHKPGTVLQMLKNTLTGQLAPGSQATAINPSGIAVTNGIQSNTSNTNQLAGPVGAPIAGTTQTQLVPLANQQGVGIDVNNNPIVTRKDAYGNIQAPQQMPGSTNAPMINYPAGESSSTKTALEQEASVARSNASRGQEMHANNRGILEALKEVVATGPAGRSIAKMAGFAGIAADSIPGANAAEKAASAYDTIGKLTEKNALAAAAAMGNETNGKIEAQIKANGSAAYNPTALRNITMLNDALVTGSEKYAVGMQKSIEASGHVFGKRQFDREWAQNANVDTLKFLNSIKTQDTAEQQILMKKAGEDGSPGRLKLMQELRNLQKLTQTGRL